MSEAAELIAVAEADSLLLKFEARSRVLPKESTTDTQGQFAPTGARWHCARSRSRQRLAKRKQAVFLARFAEAATHRQRPVNRSPHRESRQTPKPRLVVCLVVCIVAHVG